MVAISIDSNSHISIEYTGVIKDIIGWIWVYASVDHLAIPNKAGAMENWGLIMYGEKWLAVSADISSAYGVQTVASFIAHEDAHLVRSSSRWHNQNGKLVRININNEHEYDYYIVIRLDCSFILSGYFYSAPSSPLLLRSASDTARILCRSFTQQLWVKDFPKVPTWRPECDSNPRPFGRKASNLAMCYHAPLLLS